MLAGCRTPANDSGASKDELLQVLGKYHDVMTRRLNPHEELTETELKMVLRYYSTVQPNGPIGTSPDYAWGIPLTKEMDDQLVREGVLPPPEEDNEGPTR